MQNKSIVMDGLKLQKKLKYLRITETKCYLTSLTYFGVWSIS